MKLFKQPAFFIGIIALVGLIGTIVATSILYPSNATVNKLEKALTKKDVKLLQKIVMGEEGEEFDAEEFFYDWEDNLAAYMFIRDEDFEKLEIELLIGEEEKGENSNESTVPSIMVTRVGDKIYRLNGLNIALIEKDGKQYISEDTID